MLLPLILIISKLFYLMGWVPFSLMGNQISLLVQEITSKSSFLFYSHISSFFQKTLLFSKDLITFTTSFISLFVSVSPQPVIDESVLLRILYPSSRRRFGMSFFDLGRTLLLQFLHQLESLFIFVTSKKNLVDSIVF